MQNTKEKLCNTTKVLSYVCPSPPALIKAKLGRTALSESETLFKVGTRSFTRLTVNLVTGRREKLKAERSCFLEFVQTNVNCVKLTKIPVENTSQH